MKVAIPDVMESPLSKLADKLVAEDTDVLKTVVDVSDREQVSEMADAAFSRFGEVNIFCNNAGVGSSGPLHLLELADRDWVLGENLFGVIHGIKFFLPRMLAKG